MAGGGPGAMLEATNNAYWILSALQGSGDSGKSMGSAVNQDHVTRSAGSAVNQDYVTQQESRAGSQALTDYLLNASGKATNDQTKTKTSKPSTSSKGTAPKPKSSSRTEPRPTTTTESVTYPDPNSVIHGSLTVNPDPNHGLGTASNPGPRQEYSPGALDAQLGPTTDATKDRQYVGSPDDCKTQGRGHCSGDDEVTPPTSAGQGQGDGGPPISPPQPVSHADCDFTELDIPDHCFEAQVVDMNGNEIENPDPLASRLLYHTNTALSEWRSGKLGFSSEDLVRIARRPSRANTIMGSILDGRVKDLAANDPLLSRLFETPNGSPGPDWINTGMSGSGARWYDLTTAGKEWAKHVAKYRPGYGSGVGIVWR